MVDHPKSHTAPYPPVAIIGMSCLFPRSAGLRAYWRLIYQGLDGITEVPPTHWSTDDYYDSDPKTPDHTYCRRGGFLPPVSFDPTEFGIPPNSLEATDTSQLLALATAKKALRDAGYDDRRPFERTRTSVILGVTGTQELVIPLGARLGHPHWRRALQRAGLAPEQCDAIIDDISNAYVSWQESSFPGLLGNVVAGRICNRLDLGGTNCVVDAACASSMSALHLALMELAAGRSDMVVSGGVDTLNDIFMHMCFSKTHILSPSGDIRPFAKDADGTVLGEGIGLVILKRLADAERDGDRIYAVIRGLGSSSDGRSQSIYAPRPDGQARALQMAYDQAAIEPQTVELVEAHGTGTRVGDRVEFEALHQVFGPSTPQTPWCALGSVKSMIGHTKAAAGSAGLIKAALALHHKVLPPTLKVDEPDPELSWAESAFYVNRVSRPWLPRKGHPRRAGVSSFGFGGSNFHVVLEEYQSRKTEIVWDDAIQILALSAQATDQLTQNAKRLAVELDGCRAYDDTLRLLTQARKRFDPGDPYRLLYAVDLGTDHLAAQSAMVRILQGLENQNHLDRLKIEGLFYGGPQTSNRIALVFPGQGSQYPGMGRDWVCRFPAALKMLARCAEAFDGDERLLDLIYPPIDATQADRERHMRALTRTEIAQPAIGAVSLGMFHVLQQFGLVPYATCGHSYGELSALCAAGWIDIDTFIRLSIDRGQCMATAGQNATKPGAMLAVKAPLDEIKKLIRDLPDIVLSNRNSPSQGVLSGPRAAIDAAAAKCLAAGFRSFKLSVAAAFHSSMIDKAHAPFREAVSRASVSPSSIPVFSNTTAEPYPSDPQAARELMGRHMISPVNFVQEIENLYAAGVRTFIEVGPRAVLTHLIAETLQGRPVQTLALDHGVPQTRELLDLAKVLCALAAAGQRIDLAQWGHALQAHPSPRMQIELTGANYRNPETKLHRKTVSPAGSHRKTDDRQRQPTKIKRPTPETRPTMPPALEAAANITKINTKKMDKDNRSSSFEFQALEAIHEGLRAMQRLQIQTAEAHNKFLESQTEASRALQAMLASTQRLTEASWAPDRGLSMAGTDLISRSQTMQPEREPATGPMPVRHPDLSQSGVFNAPNADVEPKAPTPPDRKPDARTDNLEIEQKLLAIVSQLTGYPTEMLGLDMDIEADLGIDSIKRVEILSSLEEQLPELPAVTPEDMGTLKTLGQIVAHLCANGPVADPLSVSPALTPKPEPVTTTASTPPEEVERTLLAIVSQLTGYPTEMLGLDMDIEADLGIDSIKRVEILSSLEEQLPELPAVTPEDMGTLKTLGQIVAHLAQERTLQRPSAVEPEAGHAPVTEAFTSVAAEIGHTAMTAAPNSGVTRQVVKLKPLQGPAKTFLNLAPGRRIYVLDDQTGLSAAIVRELQSQSIDAALAAPDVLGKRTPLPDLGGLVIVPDQTLSSKLDWHPADGAFLKQAFLLAQQVAPDLHAAALAGGALLATVTRLDGAFGFKDTFDFNPLMGGLAGLVKTAALEWETVACRAIDVAPDWQDTQAVARAVAAELRSANAEGPVEIGLDQGTRITLAAQPEPYPAQGRLSAGLEAGDVVVVTGGARGVTAAALHDLAVHCRPTLILMGRSPAPSPEPEWLAGLDDDASIKKAIIKHAFAGRNPAPRELERIFRGHVSNREVTVNIEQLRETGARVEYVPVDVRDVDRMTSAVTTIRTTYGPIRGIIHGAGTLADRFIVDKTLEQFSVVFDTKITGLHTLLEATRGDELKQLVLFSSVAARSGNRGQSDYAMANEVLNKIARQEARRRPNCKVTAINWGPWDGGMVTPVLKKAFERNHLPLIALAEGARCLLLEMASPSRPSPEVIVGGLLNASANAGQPAPEIDAIRPHEPLLKPSPALALTFKREISVDTLPVLESHMLDGKPVVPLALMAEWFGHGALHNNPGLMLQGFDDLRVLKGIRLSEDTKLIRMLAGRASKKGAVYEVPVEIRDGIQDGREVIHSNARAILAETLPPPPAFRNRFNLKGYSRSVEEVYDKILFHGADLRGIQEIIGFSSQGMVAHVASAPLPEKWMRDPHRTQWIGDPLALDCAFQMASLWCYEETGSVSLPSFCARYRQYVRVFPPEGLTAVLDITAKTERKIRADITLLDSRDAVVAQISGYEAVMDTALIKAFKPQLAATA